MYKRQVIEGGHKLHGEIHPQGAKNEVLQILCATLLTSEEVTVTNIPVSYTHLDVYKRQE